MSDRASSVPLEHKPSEPRPASSATPAPSAAVSKEHRAGAGVVSSTSVPSGSDAPHIAFLFEKDGRYKKELCFFLNGSKVVETNVQPDMSLLTYLRSPKIGLTGTKLGCGEGGCGACTVMISHWDHTHRQVVNRSVNACLFPLAAVDGHHVITVEGIGNVKAGLHPIQERIAALHGSQCGFCTPGIVMALYAFLRNNPNPTREQIEESFDGNLCRCTGYRPILEAAKTFAIDAESPCGLGAACCRNKNKGAQSAEQKAEPVQLAHGHALAAEFAAEAKRLPLDPSKNVQNREAFDPPSQVTLVQSCTCAKVDCFRGCTRKSAESELIFPSELTHYNAHPLFFKGEHCVWFRPTTLQDLLQIKAQYPAAKLVVGNTELGIEMTLGKRRYPELIHTAAVPELNQLEVTEKGMYIGASVTLTNLKSFLQTLIKHREHDKKLAHTVYAASSMLTALRYFSSTQIRNSAAIGGNICTASPISDLNPVLQSLGAQLYLQSKEHAARNIDIREFFLAYRRTLLSGHEILVKIFVPFTVNNEFAFSFKQARRRDDDIAIVTSGMRVLLDAPTPHPQLSELGISAADFKVKDVTLSFGGMAPVTTCAKLTQEFLKGKSWTEDTIQACYPLLAQDLPLPPQVPGGQAEYRSALAASFLFKFYVLVSSELQKQFKIALMPPSYESAIREYHRGVSMGRQEYNVPATANASDVGKPLQHLSSKQQVSGEAKYTDDLPTPQGGLFAALVLSQQPNAHIEVNANAALRMPGVVAYIGAKDVPGSNAVGDIVTDEELFAEKTVTCCGQVIGLILAHTEVEAQRAADAVQVTYTPTDKPTIITIEAAITNNSFQGPTHTVQRGDLEAAKKQSDFQIEGEMRIGGQEHFYLETNCCQAFPGENDEMTIICSTQNPHKTQEWAAHVLGIPESRVTAQVKRMGGGFGGKETRSLIYSSAIAVAAHKLQRPVRLNVRRDQDMSSSGHRHPFLGKYKAGCSKDGLLKYVDIQLFSNGGNSMDLSMPVCDRALFHIDNAYFIPAVKAVGRVCKTNIPSNTAFRGFGGPQGMMVCESILEHVAHTVGLPVTAVRERNLYKEGQQTHYLQTLDRCHIGRMWQEIKQSADFDARRRAVDQFNAENKFRKRGIALIPTKFGCSFTAKFMNQGGALVHVYTDGSVMITHGGTEMGQGLHTKMAQIAANAFGVPISQITVAPTATDKVPNTSPTAASMSSDINGMALLDACNTIKARLAPLREKNPDKTFAEIAKMAYFERINLSAQGFHKVPDVGYDWNTNSGQPFAYFTYGVACAEVDVDVLTGDFHVARADIVMDLGASLNPGIDVGQVEGAFVQGMGWCTMEELIWGDEEHKWVKPGFLATRGPGAYKIPSFNDVPVDFRVTLLKDSANPKAIYSSKAVGEPPFFLSASVFFALKDAVQSARKDNSASEFVPFFSPATSERIRMACNDKVAQLYTKDRTQAQDGKFRPCGSW